MNTAQDRDQNSEILNRPTPRRGRKPADQSRGDDIRRKLLEWRQVPEGIRQSLRSLASELGVSHQLLGSYLKGLTRWRRKQYRREERAIFRSARAENRDLSPWESARVDYLGRAALGTLADEMMEGFERSAKRGRLTACEQKVLEGLTRHKVARASQILELASRSRQRELMTKRDAEILKKMAWVTDSDKFMRLFNQLSLEGKTELERRQK